MATTVESTTPATNKTQTTQSAKRQEAISGLVFMTPAFLILFVFLVLPLFLAFAFSLTDWNGRTPLANEGAYSWVGFQNYERLLLSGRRVSDFYNAFKNTAYYVLGVVPIQTMIAMGLAVIVNQRWLKGRSFFRTAFYFPSITSSIVVSMIFLFLFSQTGPVNGALRAIFPTYQPIPWLTDNNGVIHNLLAVVGITRTTIPFLAETEIARISLWNWLSGPSVAMFTIMMLAVWTTIGTMMVVYLAALQNISPSVYEAASVDGASPWQIFRKITLPLLKPTTFFVVTLGLIGTFQVFDQIYLLQENQTRQTTMTVAYLVYDTAFNLMDPQMGRAAATAITLFVIIFVATLLQRRFVGGDQPADT